MRFDQRPAMRWISAIHEFWYRLTGGWVGGNVLGSPVLLLTTTGRKSGRRYTTPLLYMRDGDDIIVIASNNGADWHPDWYRNLAANANAEVQVMGERRHVLAADASGVERARLWATITNRYPVYRQYERRTPREIPVVVLRESATPTDNA